MARSTITYVRAGDTEPLEITVGAAGVTDLDELTSAVLYGRVDGEEANQIDGEECTVADSETMLLSFDPAGAGPEGGDAWDLAPDEGEPVRIRCYVLLTWSDTQTTRHPAAEDGTLDIYVTASYE
jgi:hypothetical protein